MDFIKRHKGAFLIILFCTLVTILLIIAVSIFDYEKSHSLVDAKETLGAFSSYYGAIMGGILSGVLAIAGVFFSLYFYQERFREEDVKKVQPFLKLEATNRGHNHGMVLAGINLTGIEDPSRNAYPLEIQAKNIGNGYLKVHSIGFNAKDADNDSLSFVLNVNEQTTFIINVEKESRLEPFQLIIEFYDSMSNLYMQDYKVDWDDSRGYFVDSDYPRLNFASLTKFVLFDPKDGKDKQGKDLFKTIKGALIYGRNGTGKSTIAKAFRKAKGEELPTIKQVSFLDKDGSPITLSEEDKDHIFIFDEDFVNEKVKLKEDHLDTIIMLGQAADLAEKIELAEKERDSAKIVFDTMETTLEEFADKDNPKSPQNILDKIAEKLRGDDSWAGRDKRIRDKRHNTQVRDDTYKIFVHLEPKNTYSELIVDFDNHMKALVAAKAGSLIIDTKVPSIPERYYSYDDKAIISLLAKKIEKPKLNEREQFLLSLVQSGQANNLTQKASVFKNPNVKECPYCFQPLSDEYKSNLVASIEKVLTKSVEDHRKSLEVYVFDELIIDLSDYIIRM